MEFIASRPAQRPMLFSRKLRKKMTFAERVFWVSMRMKAFRGLRFRRQQVIGRMVVDFYCHPLRLAVEVDGDIPALKRPYDRRRDWVLRRKYGVQVLRFSNEDVIGRMDWVFEQIEAFVDARLLPPV